MSVSAHPTPQPGTEEYHPVFVGKTLEQLGEILTRYPTKQAALLPALWLVQQARGWISDRNMTEVAEVLGLTPAYVKGDRKSTRLNSSHSQISYAVFCLKKKKARTVIYKKSFSRRRNC